MSPLTSHKVMHYADRLLVQVPCSDLTTWISGFASNSAVHCLSSDDSSVLMQCARNFSPLDELSAEIDGQVAELHVCNGL